MRLRSMLRSLWVAILVVVLLISSAAAGEVLLNENFEHVPEGKLPPGFTVVGGTWEVRAGTLVGHSPNINVQGRVVFGDSSWTNYEISTTMTFLWAQNTSRWTAVNFRVQGETGPPYHLFTLRQGTQASNGMEQSYRTKDEQWSVVQTAAWKAPLAIGEPHRLRVVVFDKNIRYYLDDTLVLTSNSLVQELQGKVGLQVNGATVAFDDVVVKELTPDDVANLMAESRSTSDTGGAFMQWPLVIAHRGASGTAPENTMAAFRQALAIGADLIELDVHMTKDGHLVVIHDNTVNRTAKGNSQGAVSQLTLEEIRALDAGTWKGAAFTGEKVPTLEEALTAFGGEALFLLELKQAGIESQVAHVLRTTGMTKQVVFQSFDKESVRRFRALMPQVPAGVLFSNSGALDPIAKADMMVTQTLEVNGSFVAAQYGALSPEVVRYIKSRGLSVFAWTVDDLTAMRKLMDAGVDGIITNYPERLLGVISEEK